ncbi:hypothetical protein [Parafrankia discariae]|uniref:hypothetical protein n=1 Tax=Parafrankia discariae TaxID=365528 RepID=UPI001E5375B6|nr:hypothetical protein [Parafrankia discariae]
MNDDRASAPPAGRTRTTDEHMFRVESPYRVPATFRLQLFTAPNQRPVAVAIQVHGEGQSLTNGAERYAAAVWKQYFPTLVEPPIWIERQIPSAYDNNIFQEVNFTIVGPYLLGSPEWRNISAQELILLVGVDLDLDRGSGFVPPPELPEEKPRYVVTWVARLPRPYPFRASACMPTGTPWWRRLGRQIVPRRGARDCCWYHGGDWHTVTAATIRLVRRAERAGVDSDDIAACP